MEIAEYIATAGFVVNLGLVIVGLKIKAELGSTEIAMERKVETGQSEIRAEIKQVELFMRDNFVRKDTFNKMVEMMTTNMQSQFDRLDGKLDRLDAKLDRQSGHTERT